MNINEQELAEAIDAVNEGGSALGVSCEDVYRKMLINESFMMKMMKDVHAWNSCVDFEAKFCLVARDMLTEALRTKQEINAGLM